MPRAKKTMGGAPGQAVNAVKGQTYGQGVAQEALQRAMPAPNQPAIAPVAAPSQSAQPQAPASQPQPQSNPAPQPMSINDVQKMVSGIGGVLNAPDDRPNTPFTAGLNSPSNMASTVSRGVRKTKTIETFRNLTISTGDPIFAELAERMGF